MSIKKHPAKNSLIHVAVGVIERVSSSGVRSILISKRSQNVHQGGFWEFPGGKVECGESVIEALSRELHEELGLELLQGAVQQLIQIEHDYGDKQVLLDVWRVRQFSGEPHGREGQPLRWVPVNQLMQYTFPAANQSIIRACLLPQQYVITPEYASLYEAQENLAFLLEHDASLILFRQPQLSESEYSRFVCHLCATLPGLSGKLMLSGHILSSGSFVRGVHLPYRMAASLTQRPVEIDQLFAVSCHNESEVRHAEGIGADFITLSPVQVTASHPEVSKLGWKQFKQWAEKSKIPVFAQGGMKRSDLPGAISNGAQGISGIRLWQ